MTWSLHGHPLRAVLVSRLRYLGDIAMTTPILEILRRGDPDLDIGYLCEAAYAPLLVDHPHLNRLHALAAHRSSSDAKVRRTGEALAHAGGPDTRGGRVAGEKGNSGSARGTWAMVRELRRHRYDLCVDLFFNPRSAWLLRFSGSRWRIGGSKSWRRHLYTHTIMPAEPAAQPQFWAKTGGGLGDHLSRLAPLHHVESDLPFLTWFATQGVQEHVRTHITAPSLVGSLPERILTEFGLDPTRGFVLLAPGSTWPAKEWPVEHWSTLLEDFARTVSHPLVVLRPPLRTEQYEKLANAIPAGRGGVLPYLSLKDALRVVAAASLVVCVDGGIMHASVAMGRPTLALFGPTALEIWFPYEGRGPFRVLATQPHCHPCDRLECHEFICLPDLRPERVAGAVYDLLGITAEAG